MCKKLTIKAKTAIKTEKDVISWVKSLEFLPVFTRQKIEVKGRTITNAGLDDII